MARFTPMAPDSAGFQTLLRLYEAGGICSVRELIAGMWSEFRSRDRFHQVAGLPLRERDWVVLQKTEQGEVFEITKAGRLIVERYKVSLPAVRVIPSEQFRPAKGAVFKYEERRPGSHDYRKMPSLMGDKRVPFRGAADEASET